MILKRKPMFSVDFFQNHSKNENSVFIYLLFYFTMEGSRAKSKKFIEDFAMGGMSGIISKTVVAPMERVKLLMQTQRENIKVKRPYKGIFDCLIRCVQEDGTISLWRGNWVNVVRYFPTQALSFAFKDYFNSLFKLNSQTNEQKIKYLGVRVMNGGIAGAATTLFVHPLDFVRTRIGVDLGKSKQEREFKGLNNCLMKTFKKEGIQGLYRGIGVAIPSIFIYRGLYFGIYDTGKQIVLSKDVSIVMKFIWAQWSVIFSQFLAYPGDTVKRKMMMLSLKEVREYSGTVDCFVKIYQSQGLPGFWRGGYSNLLRSVGSSLCLVLYDELAKCLREKNEL